MSLMIGGRVQRDDLSVVEIGEVGTGNKWSKLM